MTFNQKIGLKTAIRIGGITLLFWLIIAFIAGDYPPSSIFYAGLRFVLGISVFAFIFSGFYPRFFKDFSLN